MTKLLGGIVKENDKLSDQTDFYGMVSPFVAFYWWSGLLRGRVRLSILATIWRFPSRFFEGVCSKWSEPVLNVENTHLASARALHFENMLKTLWEITVWTRSGCKLTSVKFYPLYIFIFRDSWFLSEMSII